MRERLLTVKEAAERLNASAALVYDLVGARKMRSCRIGNGRGRIRIPESAIDEYLASVTSSVRVVIVRQPIHRNEAADRDWRIVL
jgi:excisionase family DNA binding protein